MSQWGSYGQADGQFVEPIDVEVGPDGSVYVVDDARDDIQKFDSEGNFLLKIGEHGSGPGQLDYTGSITLDDAGVIYVADFNNNRVQAFDPEGRHLWTLGSRGADPGEFTFPGDVALDGAGNLNVVDARRVQVFDAERHPVAEWTVPVTGDAALIAIVVGDGGFAYATEIVSGQIYKLRSLPLPVGSGNG